MNDVLIASTFTTGRGLQMMLFGCHLSAACFEIQLLVDNVNARCMFVLYIRDEGILVELINH